MLADFFSALPYYSFLAAVLVVAIYSLLPRRRPDRTTYRPFGEPTPHVRQDVTLLPGIMGSADVSVKAPATKVESDLPRAPIDYGAIMYAPRDRMPTLTMPLPGFRLPSLSTGSTTSAAGDASTTRLYGGCETPTSDPDASGGYLNRPYGDYADLSPYWRARLEAHDLDAA